MTTYYVGPGGNNANAGTSWALRKLTLNGAEDIPVAAGDTVYVGPGTYRETLTLDVSGAAGSPVTYIGDYTGANTDGVGGVVRITGSDNDQTATRASCIAATTQRNYRTFSGLLLDMVTTDLVDTGTAAGTNWIITECLFTNAGAKALDIAGANQLAWTISDCGFLNGGVFAVVHVEFGHSSGVDNTGHVVSNCLFDGPAGGRGVQSLRVGGITVRNCTLLNMAYGVRVFTVLTAGQTVKVNNCLLKNISEAFRATTVDEFVENYNSIFGCATPRTNVNTGANSNAYPPLFDTRWFFEALNGGRMLSPFDLAPYSQLINVAGTSPTTTDLRGTSAIGGQREWGALEYDSALYTDGAAAASILDSAGGTYHAPDAAEVIDTAVFGPASVTLGTMHLPAAGEVIDTAVFGPSSGTAGTFAIPAEVDVRAGTFYGADGTEFEGELVTGGGCGVVLGSNIVRGVTT